MSTTTRLLSTAVLLAVAMVSPAGAFPVRPADNDQQFSPATAITVEPTLSVSPSVGRLCFPGSTCP